MTKACTNFVGAQISRLRHARGLTQAQLASIAGTQAIAMIESGHRLRPQHETLAKIATALGVSVDEITLKRTGKRKRVTR